MRRAPTRPASPSSAASPTLTTTGPERATIPRAGALFGGYLIDEPLGRASKFQLWLASPWDEASSAADRLRVGQLVLKTAHVGRASGGLGSLLAAARRVVHLRHWTLARLLDVGVNANFIFAATENVQGRDLSQLLGGRCHLQPRGVASSRSGRWPCRPLPVELALHVALEVCQGLRYAHGLLDRSHGDIAPWHVMVSFSGEVKLLNYGLTQLSSGLKSDGIAESWASFRYKAPEQLAGAAGDKRSDLYSMGLVLFELLAGQPWVQGDADSGLLTASREPWQRMDALWALDLPQAVTRVLVRALQHEPRARFQSAAEMGIAISDALCEARLQPSAEALARHMWRTFQHGREEPHPG